MNFLHTLWFGYFWPSDKGNGPEAILELIILAVIGRLIWPKIKRHIDALHHKMNHIIEHHPDIPDYHPPQEEKNDGPT